MAVSGSAFDQAFARFTICYRASLRTPPEIVLTKQVWRESLSRNSWVDDPLFDEAAAWTIDNVKDYLPSPATFLERCRELQHEREEAERWRLLLLPKPREKRIDELSQEERDALRAVFHEARAAGEAATAKRAQAVRR